MNWITLRIFLQNQNAWPLGIIRIVFDYYSIIDTGYNIPYKNIIFGKFVITMV